MDDVSVYRYISCGIIKYMATSQLTQSQEGGETLFHMLSPYYILALYDISTFSVFRYRDGCVEHG